MKKNLLLVGLSLLTAFTASAYSFEAKNADGVTIYYDYDTEDIYAVSVTTGSSDGNSYSGSVSIPETVSHLGKTYTVNAIGASAFAQSDELSRVIVPRTVKSIGKYAFSQCPKLGTIALNIANPADLTVDADAFEGTPMNMMFLFVPEGSVDAYKAVEPWNKCLVYLEIGYDFEAVNAEGTTMYYTFNEDGTSVSVSYGLVDSDSYSGDVTIPETVTYGGKSYKVTAIGYRAFYGCPGLTKVTIPATVKTIGRMAFRDNENLATVSVGAGVKSIEDEAFSLCPKLGMMAMFSTNPAGIALGKDVFINTEFNKMYLFVRTDCMSAYQGAEPWKNCYMMMDIPYDFAARNADETMMYYNINHDGKSVTVSCGLTDENSYSDDVKIPETVTYEGETYDVTAIGYKAFYGCPGLTNVTIPETVKTIGRMAFRNNENLMYVTIGAGVTSIAADAFSLCPNLGIMTMLSKDPASVTVGADVFASTPVNKAFLFVPKGCMEAYKGMEPWSSFLYFMEVGYDFAAKNADGVDIYYNVNEDETSVTVSYGTLDEDSYAGSVTIPETVTYDGKTYDVTAIGFKAFYGCPGLTKVTMPETITEIGGFAFKNNANLLSADIPGSVTTIGASALSECASLTTIDVPESVTTIGNYAFSFNENLQTVNLPNSLTAIAPFMFIGNPSLSRIEIPASVTEIGRQAFTQCPNLGIVAVFNDDPSKINVDENAFYGTDVKKIFLFVPKGCTEAYKAVEPWKNFLLIMEIDYDFEAKNEDGVGIYYTINDDKTSVTVTYGILDENSYAGDVNVPATVTHDGETYDVTAIGFKAFYGCPFMTSVTMPESITEIGGFAFKMNPTLTSIRIPGAVTTIGASAFSECAGLTTIDVPESVTSIGNYAFSFNKRMTTVNLPNSLTAIAPFMFIANPSLATMRIPASVTEIGRQAFAQCPALKAMTVENASPASITMGENVFNGDNLQAATLYVPQESVNLYKEAEQWKEFGTIEEIDPSSVIESIVTDSAEQGVYFDLMGRRVENPAAGIYIINGRKVIVK